MSDILNEKIITVKDYSKKYTNEQIEQAKNKTLKEMKTFLRFRKDITRHFTEVKIDSVKVNSDYHISFVLQFEGDNDDHGRPYMARCDTANNKINKLINGSEVYGQIEENIKTASSIFQERAEKEFKNALNGNSSVNSLKEEIINLVNTQFLY